jgi:group I intron endonuclease
MPLETPSKGFIYLILGKYPGGGIYVGQTTDITKRWSRHRSDFKDGKHGNRYLQRAWNKYGEDVFEFKIAEEVITDLTISEQFWIDAYRAAGVMIYNVAVPGDSPMLGRHLSDEHRKKISDANLGNQHTLGRKLSDETKAKISLANKGKVRSHEACMKLSNRMKGNKYNLGRSPSQETRNQISESEKKTKRERKLLCP